MLKDSRAVARRVVSEIRAQERRPLSHSRDVKNFSVSASPLNSRPISSSSVRASAVIVPQPRLGAGIINSKGVPGTLGCIAYMLHNGQPALLSNWHVLFGNDANEDSAVWLLKESDDGHRFSRIGKTLYGKRGLVQFAGEDYYVDCAVASFTENEAMLLSDQNRTMPPNLITGYATAQLGDVVTKTGAATGVTRGTVIDVSYSDPTVINDKEQVTPRQLLVTPLEDRVFSAEGDSGAVVVDTSNKAVALLWGTNVRGEGVACPIVPILYAMNITLDPPALVSR